MGRQNVTTWTSPICGCQLYITADAQGRRVVLDAAVVRSQHQARIDAGDPTALPTLAPPLFTCADHKGLGGKVLGDAMQEEMNRLAQTTDLVKAAGTEDLVWWFDPERVLHVLSNKLSPAQINQLRNQADSAFGAGRVKVE